MEDGEALTVEPMQRIYSDTGNDRDTFLERTNRENQQMMNQDGLDSDRGAGSAGSGQITGVYEDYDERFKITKEWLAALDDGRHVG
jgi:hypothetical protein